jgi:hypothetical protein
MSALTKRLTPSDRKALIVLSVIVMLPVVVVALAGAAQGLIAAIITTAGWATIPVWAAWAIIGTDSVGLVIAILGAVGIYNPPMWVVWALIAAASVSL